MTMRAGYSKQAAAPRPSPEVRATQNRSRKRWTSGSPAIFRLYRDACRPCQEEAPWRVRRAGREEAGLRLGADGWAVRPVRVLRVVVVDLGILRQRKRTA